MGNIQFVFEGHFSKYRSLFQDMCPPPMTIRKGCVLCSQCHTSGWMYYMLDGISKVYITTNDGNERIIDFMKKDTLIGMDCINAARRSVVSISSITDMQVLPFTPEMLRQMLLRNPELGFDLAVYYGEVLRQVAYTAGNMGIADLTGRLAAFLLLFLDTPDYKKTRKIALTQEEIASFINVSRAQVAKMFGQLRKEGVIATGNRYVTFLDQKKLMEYSAF